MQPPPAGIWGLPAEKLAELPGYSSDAPKNRAEARATLCQDSTRVYRIWFA